MKMVAIMDRGTKRDFVDLYEIMNRGRSTEDIFIYYQKKYNLLKENQYSIIRSLQYFDDAEDSEMPKMIKPVSWEEVKDFFAKETVQLARKYI